MSALARRVRRRITRRRRRPEEALPVTLPDGTVVPHDHPDVEDLYLGIHLDPATGRIRRGERVFASLAQYDAWYAERKRQWLRDRGLDKGKTRGP